MLWVIDVSLILFTTSWGVYSIPNESKYTAKFISINNEIQCVSYYFYHLDLLNTLHNVLGKLLFEKTPLNLGS